MKRKIFSILGIALVAVFAVSCSDDDNSTTDGKGQVSVKMTDAPSDDTAIEGTFITVSKVKIDGQEVEGFQKQTFDISAYQEGETKLLFSDEIDAKSYNSISIVLDYETDAEGNSPGCYVLTTDSEKHDLAASSDAETEIMFNKNFMVENNQNTDLVIDIDLRKSIKHDDESADTDYSFVSTTELQSSVRLVTEDEASMIQGEIENNTASDLEFIVYAYKKGEYNFVSETQGQGSSNVLFANAVTSAKVKNDGTYKLAFLEDGEYEIHIATYSRSSLNGEMSFTGMAIATSLINSLILDEIMVSSATDITLDISITVST